MYERMLGGAELPRREEPDANPGVLGLMGIRGGGDAIEHRCLAPRFQPLGEIIFLELIDVDGKKACALRIRVTPLPVASHPMGDDVRSILLVAGLVRGQELDESGARELDPRLELPLRRVDRG